ncbi:MAG: type II toxin-antitoxin system VapB family antitoxin [Chloroflexi bacterium]|nr:type II toxin-antitoxin system VapB family antitoxin [Chloroflexota bacterium]
MMRTTLDIDQGLLDDVVKATGEKSKSRAVEKALKLYVRQLAINDLRYSTGKVIVEDLSREQSEAEERRRQNLDNLGKQ